MEVAFIWEEFVMASSKLSIFKVKLQSDISWDSILNSLLQMDSEDLHCVISEQGKDYIGGYYLISVAQNQKIFNFEDSKFETITVKRQNVVKFDIFLFSGKMLLWGNKRSADMLITAFVQAANNQLVVDSCNVEYIQILNHLLTMKNVRFSRMRITDVLIDEGIVANCSVCLSSLDDPQRMIQKYKNCISQLTVLIEGGVSPVSLTIYSSGSVVLSKDRDDIDDETLESINVIVGGEL